jgi:hypothetical protein
LGENGEIAIRKIKYRAVRSSRYHHNELILAGVFVIAVFAMAAAPAARAQGSAGTISSVSGHVQIHRGATSLAASPGIAVNQGDQIGCAADGNAVIILNDQSQLTIRPSTTITLDQYTSGGATPTRIGLVSGVMKSSVNGTSETPANYQVHTFNAIVTARGTAFYTSYTSSSPQTGNLPGVSHYTEVAVLEGTVNLAQAAAPNRGVEVAQGTTGTVAGDDPPDGHKRKFPTCSAPPTSVDQCKDGGWRNFPCGFKNQGQCISYVHHAQ